MRTGNKLVINSSWRSLPYQQKLYQLYLSGKNKYNVAYPNIFAPHYLGSAVDIDERQANELAQMGILDRNGLVQPDKYNDPVHIEHKDWFNLTGQQRYNNVGKYTLSKIDMFNSNYIPDNIVARTHL